jgi:CheY-like chemotaxis protein
MKSVAQLLATVRADFDDLDLLVLDLRMPHAAGVELIKRIRKLDGGKLPILLFSGSVSGVDEVRELAALGVSGYLNEYISVEHIVPSVAPHLFPETFNRRKHPRAAGHSGFTDRKPAAAAPCH